MICCFLVLLVVEDYHITTVYIYMLCIYQTLVFSPILKLTFDSTHPTTHCIFYMLIFLPLSYLSCIPLLKLLLPLGMRCLLRRVSAGLLLIGMGPSRGAMEGGDDTGYVHRTQLPIKSPMQGLNDVLYAFAQGMSVPTSSLDKVSISLACSALGQAERWSPSLALLNQLPQKRLPEETVSPGMGGEA